MTSVGVDLSSAEIWLPFAISTLKRMNLDVPSYATDKLEAIQASLAMLDKGKSPSQGGSNLDGQVSRPPSVFSQMYEIGKRFKENGIPHSRKQLLPVAVAGRTIDLSPLSNMMIRISCLKMSRFYFGL